ncbi:hypothetical protein KIN20_028907, partial [Parelaphostrongylus tenuis]
TSAFLPPDDAYVPHEGVENLQRLRGKNFFTDFKVKAHLEYLQDHNSPQPTPWHNLEVTLPRRGRCVGFYRKVILR